MPWQGVKDKDFQKKLDKILEIKSTLPLTELCSEMPQEFVSYLEYCRKLKFDEQPDYKYLIKLFQDVLIKMEEDLEEIEYDWERNENLIKRRMSFSPTLNSKYLKLRKLGPVENLNLSPEKKYAVSPEVPVKSFTMMESKDNCIELFKLDKIKTKPSIKVDYEKPKNKKVSFSKMATVFNHNDTGGLLSKEEKELNLDVTKQIPKDIQEKYKDVLTTSDAPIVVNNNTTNNNNITINNYTIEEKKETCHIF